MLCICGWLLLNSTSTTMCKKITWGLHERCKPQVALYRFNLKSYYMRYYFSPFTSSEQVMPRRIMSFIVGFRRVRNPSHERFCCFVQPPSARAIARG